MKKFMYIILLALCLTWASYAETGTDLSMVNPEILENQILREQLVHETGMKNHYQKMAVYSEIDAENSERDKDRYKEYISSLENLIDTERLAYLNINKGNQKLIDDNNSTMIHYQSVVSGYEMQLYAAMQEREADAIKYEAISARLERESYNTKLILMGLIICAILYIAQRSILNIKRSTPKADPLTIVPKSDGGAGVKEVKEPKVKKAKPIVTKFEEGNDKPPMNAPVDKPNAPTKREQKEMDRVAKLREKALTEKEGDIIETETIQDMNKKLASKGSAMSGMIKAIFKAKPPKEPVVETFEEVTKETVVKPKPKTETKPKVTTTSNRSARGSRNTSGGKNGKNNKDKDKPVVEQKDKK